MLLCSFHLSCWITAFRDGKATRAITRPWAGWPLITRPPITCPPGQGLSGIGFLQTGMESGFVPVGAGEVGMWRGARSPGETTSLAVALRPSIDRGEGDRKGLHG